MRRRELVFEVPGEPVPKARARVVGGHAYTPERTSAYERTVSLLSRAARSSHPQWPLDARYSLRITLYPGTARRSDIDNAVKALADGMRGSVYLDDSQIDHIDVVRLWGEPPARALVAVTVLEAPGPQPKRPAARAPKPHPWAAERMVTPKRTRGVQ